MSILYWHWLTLGLVLMAIEIFAPGVVFLWLGIAGILVGLALLAMPDMPWEMQLVLFSILSVISVFLGRRFVYARQRPTDHPTLNRRGDTLIGQQHTLGEATSGGRGQLRIGDSMWAISVSPQGDDLTAGTRVTVVKVDGATLVIQAVS